jgi:hypothetical protein
VDTRFLKVGLERLFQLNISRFLDHRRQRLDDLIFGGKQHPQLVTIKFPQGIKVGREKFHLYSSFCWDVLMTESTSGGFNEENPVQTLFQSPGPLGFSNAGWAYRASLNVSLQTLG